MSPANINEDLLEVKLHEIEMAKQFNPRTITELRTLIETADDYDLFRLNPIQLAAEKSIDVDDCINRHRPEDRPPPGPAIVVSLNDRLDFFGQTVNIAARDQGLAGAGDIMLSTDVHADPGVREALSGREVCRGTGQRPGYQ